MRAGCAGRSSARRSPASSGLAAFDFPTGTLLLTEASPKKRASLHVVKGDAALAALDPGGLEPLGSSLADFTAALQRESHTVKRALTDPHLFSGIGNAYSDEILWRAKLSPLKLTGKLTGDELARLHDAVQTTLTEWTARLAKDTGDDFPEKVTAFRDEMAVHGKYRKPCPACGAPVQRIAYAANEANYCAKCQTGASSSPTGRSRASCTTTGRRPSRSWRRGGRGEHARLRRQRRRPRARHLRALALVERRLAHDAEHLVRHHGLLAALDGDLLHRRAPRSTSLTRS